MSAVKCNGCPFNYVNNESEGCSLGYKQQAYTVKGEIEIGSDECELEVVQWATSSMEHSKTFVPANIGDD